MDFATQSIGLKSVINARELGGYRLPDGRIIKRGMLLRGGSFFRLVDDDVRRLREEYHLAKVFDFRTSMEVGHEPDRQIPGVTNIWMPAFNEESQAMEGLSLPVEAYRDLGNWLVAHAWEDKVQDVARSMYMEMVSSDFTQMQYAGFLQNIVNTETGAVYWHCSQGKDRTGLGAALVLAALGADRELIMQDFMISNEFYIREVTQFCSMVKTEAERAAIRTFIGVNPDYFGRALDLVESRYGSLMEFLTGPLCLSVQDIAVLRQRYTE